MKCPHCGVSLHDKGLDRFCPSCGKELPHKSPEQSSIMRDRRISIGLLISSIMFVVFGASLMLPDLIIHAIDPGMGPMFWPYNMIILVIGFVFLVIRHPFAKRSRNLGAVLLEQAQARWTCSYCGAENAWGSVKCASCGAPLNKE